MKIKWQRRKLIHSVFVRRMWSAMCVPLSAAKTSPHLLSIWEPGTDPEAEWCRLKLLTVHQKRTPKTPYGKTLVSILHNAVRYYYTSSDYRKKKKRGCTDLVSQPQMWHLYGFGYQLHVSWIWQYDCLTCLETFSNVFAWNCRCTRWMCWKWFPHLFQCPSPSFGLWTLWTVELSEALSVIFTAFRLG